MRDQYFISKNLLLQLGKQNSENMCNQKGKKHYYLIMKTRRLFTLEMNKEYE